MLKNLKQRKNKNELKLKKITAEKIFHFHFPTSYRAVHVHPVNELGLRHVLKSGLHIKAKRTFGIEHLLDRFENNDMSKK